MKKLMSNQSIEPALASTQSFFFILPTLKLVLFQFMLLRRQFFFSLLQWPNNNALDWIGSPCCRPCDRYADLNRTNRVSAIQQQRKCSAQKVIQCHSKTCMIQRCKRRDNVAYYMYVCVLCVYVNKKSESAKRAVDGERRNDETAESCNASL